jgi:tetratricopeptide (TPR) repeat protein
MSSAEWIEPSPAADLRLRLALLCDALDMLDQGAFLFAVCEEGPLRKRLMRHVHDHVSEGHRELIGAELSPEQPDLAGQLEQRLLYESPEEGGGGATPPIAQPVRDRPCPPVVFVHTCRLADAGMPVAHLSEDHPERARVEQTRRALRALNFQRERLSRLGVPLVFWLSQNTLGQVAQRAADVFAARSGIFFFETPRQGPTAPPPMRAEAIVDLMDRFDRSLLPPEELRRRAALYEQRLEQEQTAEAPQWPGIAFLCRDLTNIYRELDDYERAWDSQEEAVKAYQNAIAERERKGEGKDEGWAALHVWLGLTYHRRIRGERAENLEQAITCYQAALEVYSRDAFPENWAMTQNNLGVAYYHRIRGERAENLERAIACFQATLKVRTRDTLPVEWAGAQNNLGLTYVDRIRGERAKNLEQAIACYQAALEVRTRDAFPKDWAMTQSNLGAAYFNRIHGKRTENLERAIVCYSAALEVYSRDAFPENWAMTQNNLGSAYVDRIRGDRAENLKQAIACFDAALDVRTRDAFPEDWATTQNNLGNAYADRIGNEQAGNLERAIACFQAALEVRTRDAFPEDWAMVQNNLGIAFSKRIRGNRTENLGRAITCFNDALTVWTASAFPHYHEITTHNLKKALSHLNSEGAPQL